MNNLIKKDIVILVIASYQDIYNKIVKVYWNPLINYVNNNYPNIKIYLMYGNSYQEDLNINPDNLLKFPVKETYIPGILKKTLRGFVHVYKKYDFKFILRTNISSFFIIKNLIAKSKTLPNEHYLYSGNKLFSKNTWFASGAAFWINKKTLEFIILNASKIDYKVIDDVSIGRLIETNPKINIFNLTRFDYVENNKHILKNINNDLSKINQHYHIRIKSRKSKKRVLDDVPIFQYLTNLYYL